MSIISTAIAPYRLYAELGLIAALAVTGATLYVEHNHKEQSIGAQKCIASTTETKQEATSNVQTSESQHAAQLAGVVAVYDAKIASLNSSRDTLAQRLHDADRPVRAGAVSGVAPASGKVCDAAVDAATRQIEAEHADSFAACLANQDEVEAIRTAWAELAQKNGGRVAP